MSLRPVPQLAISFVESVEGCVLTPYLDSTGHWTDGYGNTVGVVPHGPPITQAEADYKLRLNLTTAAQRLADVVPEASINELSEHEYAALLSFVFNLGANPSWTIWKDLHEPYDTVALADVPNQIKRFDKGVVDGKLVDIPGLDHRRLAEITLWNTADLPAAVATATAVPQVSSSVTRDAIVTPPTPVAKPMDAASLAVKVTTATGAIGATAAQLHDQIAPHVSEVPQLQHIAVILTMVVVSCSVIALIIHNAQAQAAKV